MSRRLFHIAPAADWQRHDRDDPWEPPSLASEGFVHLSFAEQLPGTLALHFAGEVELVVVELAPERLGDALRLESSRGGALFPHLNRAIDAADVVAETRLVRTPGAAWDVPTELSDR